MYTQKAKEGEQNHRRSPYCIYSGVPTGTPEMRQQVTLQSWRRSWPITSLVVSVKTMS